ncbi:DUF4245 family protein [Agromyces seonyuensis]|uniref:DUF4245 family protein n=1 Tax=Agromyces seonyuensis TaxID=2662446 RepID=A0A6I4NVK3_9MICO|nr:DUF4245 family protein [Agromyces seonyuensis]MWB98350.1 DUF4245 family protein [Agromyces seonyuensis]
MARKPGIVAELGRPETPEETAARKAKASRIHGGARTTRNLIWALVGSLLVLVVIILGVPRGSSTTLDNPVDYRAAAAEVQSGEPGRTIAVPNLDSGWKSNAAELRTDADTEVESWYLGFVTPGGQFLGMHQGFDATDEWVDGIIGDPLSTTTATVDGVEWTVYDNRASAEDVGNIEYAMVTGEGESTFVLFGTAEPAEFAEFAEAIGPAVAATPAE